MMLTDFIEKKYSWAREVMPDSDYQGLYIFSSTAGDKPITSRAIQQFLKRIIRSVDKRRRQGSFRPSLFSSFFCRSRP